MGVTTDRPETVIVVAAGQASFYEYLRARGRADRESLAVILDRRAGERRVQALAVERERRGRERRAQAPEAARALMKVLGFAVLHRVGDRYTV
jgi:hypothetical protein